VEPVDLREVVLEIADLLRLTSSKKVELLFEFPDELPLVKADVAQIRQLVMNLMTNAADAIGDQNGQIRIGLRTQQNTDDSLMEDPDSAQKGRLVVIEITDNGCGMSEATRESMFKPFFSTKDHGHGLGLAAAQGIIRGHGGAISVRSEVDIGTSVHVALPATKEEPPPAHNSPTKTLEPGGGEHVLVVDDEAMILELATEALRRMGFVVSAAADGHQALQILAQDPMSIDVVLLDMTMPRMSGKETFYELRKLRPQLPIILSSGYSDIEKTSLLTEGVFVDFLQKPYRISDLIDKIRSACRGDSDR